MENTKKKINNRYLLLKIETSHTTLVKECHHKLNGNTMPKVEEKSYIVSQN